MTSRDSVSRRPLTHLVRVLRRWSRQSSGTTTVEFAIIAFPFFAVVAAIFEIAFVHYNSELLTGAVSNAARAMLTGQTQTANITTASQFVNTYLCPSSGRTLPSNMDCSRLIVDVRPAASFTSGDLSRGMYKSATNVFCPGAPGQVVVVRVAYPLGAIFPLNLFSRTAGVVNDVPNSSGWYHILLGTALFQEENYTGAFTPQVGC